MPVLRDDRPVDIGRLWHNAYATTTGLAPAALAAKIAAAQSATLSPDARAVVAGIKRGTNVTKLARERGIPMNNQQDFILAGAEFGSADSLRVRAIAPGQHEIDELRKKWAELADVKPDQLTAASLDRSETNLSSIVLVVTLGAKRILLTGDALSSRVVRAVKDITDDLHFDVIKVAHHGSARNSTEADFAALTADHYVISGNGMHGNPDQQTLDALAAARGDAEYTVWCTYDRASDPTDAKAGPLEQRLIDWNTRQQDAARPSKLIAMDGKASIRIDL